MDLPFIFIKKLGPDDNRIQCYLGHAQPMTQGYFGFYSMRDPIIVGSWRAQAPRVRRGCAQPPDKQPKRHVCAGGVPSTNAIAQHHVCARVWSQPRHEPKRYMCVGMRPALRHILSATCAQGVCPTSKQESSATRPHMVFLR